MKSFVCSALFYICIKRSSSQRTLRASHSIANSSSHSSQSKMLKWNRCISPLLSSSRFVMLSRSRTSQRQLPSRSFQRKRLRLSRTFQYFKITWSRSMSLNTLTINSRSQASNYPSLLDSRYRKVPPTMILITLNRRFNRSFILTKIKSIKRCRTWM